MRQFLPYIHSLRGIAILYVIAVHARGFSSYWHSSPEVYSVLDLFSDPSEGNGTTLFLFIGGFLFQHLTQKRFHYGQYLQQKFRNLILPYVIISIPLIWIRLNTDFRTPALPDEFHQWSTLHQAGHFLLTGSHLPPCWFISTIILFYFTAAVLHVIDHPRFYKYVFPFIMIAVLFTYRPEHNANPYLSYLHFIPVYILGMWASRYKEQILSDRGPVIYILLGAYLGLCMAELIGWIDVPRTTTFEDVLSGVIVFNVYLFKALILCFFWLMFFYRIRERSIPMLEILGNYSFGLFFVHYFFISISRTVFEQGGIMFDFSLLSYMIYFLLILIAAIVTVYLVKRLTGRYSRYLIGS